MGDHYTIADIATFPWVNNLIGFYEAGELVGITSYPHVMRALEAFLARPAVIRGLEIRSRSDAERGHRGAVRRLDEPRVQRRATRSLNGRTVRTP